MGGRWLFNLSWGIGWADGLLVGEMEWTDRFMDLGARCLAYLSYDGMLRELIL